MYSLTKKRLSVYSLRRVLLPREWIQQVGEVEDPVAEVGRDVRASSVVRAVLDVNDDH